MKFSRKELRYMLSEEEKKAIERFKANANYCITSKETTQTILNLIETQQKELDNNTERINELINEVTLKDSELDKKEQEIKELKKQLIALTYKSSVKGVRR